MLSYYLILCAKVRKNCVGWCMKGPRNTFFGKKNYHSHNGVADMEGWLPADVFRF